MFKAILREALQSKCQMVNLVEGKFVCFISSQGESQQQKYATLKGDWVKGLFKALFPKNYQQIEAGETCVGGFSLQGIGKVAMIARVKPENSIWLFMPPDGESRCKDFWDKLHQQPSAPQAPSPPPPPPMTNTKQSEPIGIPQPGSLGVSNNPQVPPSPEGGQGSSMQFTAGAPDRPGANENAVQPPPSPDGFSLQGTEYLDNQSEQGKALNLKPPVPSGSSGFDPFQNPDQGQDVGEPSLQSTHDSSMGSGTFPSSQPAGQETTTMSPSSEDSGFSYGGADMFGSKEAQTIANPANSQEDLFGGNQMNHPVAAADSETSEQGGFNGAAMENSSGFAIGQEHGSQGAGIQEEQLESEANLLHMKQSVNTQPLPNQAAPLEQAPANYQVSHQPVAVMAPRPEFEKPIEVDFSNEVPGTISKGDGSNPIDQILRGMIDNRASDLHLTIGQPVIFRIDGDICRAKTPNLDSDTMKSYILPIMPKVKQSQFAKTWDVDFAYEVGELGRFRVNVFRDYHGIGSVMRHIPDQVLSADQLKLPDSIRRLCTLSKGLVLVTGPTGSGKSTTLAAMIDLINSNRSEHILTIEDPIEFVHSQKKCLVNQREVGKHTDSFSAALKAALREDPDIVLVGELRDLETTAIALETAETGHLVFATLHTNTAISTVDRIIDQFPADQQRIIRNMLATSMKGVIAQSLCKKKGGGRCAAYEILIPNDAVGSMIRESKNHMIGNHIQTQQADGNCLMADSLTRLVADDKVRYWDAWAKAIDKKEFEEYAKRRRISVPPPS